MGFGLADVAAVVVLLLIVFLVLREFVFRWRIRLRVLMGDGELLNDSRVKVIEVIQAPEGSMVVDAIRMVAVED
ncbi:MAG TPA: hypothetical protein HA247_02290 [Candidatus Thalassarchaeaceae archaeon]|nr:MAG TPA: hypothetical protein D7H98_02310 [Candidatus Poseidoniales archaeon]HII89826.1 hypothetical protein [Candidatus Thalassarchaeaceae archaeon]|tara:strand:- start:121 stop:342 length:222 start_codon:yes stop_codon:yes gene_type:complete